MNRPYYFINSGNFNYHLAWCCFRPTNQVNDLQFLPFIRNHKPVVLAEHLVHFTLDHLQVGFGNPFKERGKHQVKPVHPGFSLSRGL